jgi:sulfate transport system substrate-binding protein
VFDTGGRAATTTFVEREIGDVLITFESETTGIANEFGTDKFEQVAPSVSLLAEFPVAIVDKVVDEHGTRELAKTYLDYLYSPEGQKIAAENGNRVRDEKTAEEFKAKFPDVRLVTVEDVFGGGRKSSKNISLPAACSTRRSAADNIERVPIFDGIFGAGHASRSRFITLRL